MFGSPPRAWGQRDLTHRRDFEVRFTPTCVGTTRMRCCIPGHISVHPHVRGDNLAGTPMKISMIGSPPRAWGQRVILQDFVTDPRFTPTCVGTTFIVSVQPRDVSVHPHVRGDNATEAAEFRRAFGSPPRAWGQPAPDRAALHQCRFTPTCVGTTRWLR